MSRRSSPPRTKPPPAPLRQKRRHKLREIGRSDKQIQVRVVALLWPKTGGKGYRLELLFSTDTNMDVTTIIRLYRSRFAMEFPFRDGKQFAGLSDCQSRQTEAIHFHWNMSLLAVTTARLSALRNHKTGPFIFSMEDEKRRSYNSFFAERIFSILGYTAKVMKIGEPLWKLLGLGVKAA